MEIVIVECHCSAAIKIQLSQRASCGLVQLTNIKINIVAIDIAVTIKVTLHSCAITESRHRNIVKKNVASLPAFAPVVAPICNVTPLVTSLPVVTVNSYNS